MKYKYIIVSSVDTIWGKQVLSKEYFVGAAQRGDLIIDLEQMKYFDKDKNAWLDIEGDK